MTAKETAADLLAQARRDYGTAAERAARQTEARIQNGMARTHGNEAAGTSRGGRR